MTAFDQALFLLSARCRKIEEDLGVKVSHVVLEAASKDGSALVQAQYRMFDGKFEAINTDLLEKDPEYAARLAAANPGPEVVLPNDKIFAPPALPDEAPVERVEVLPPAAPEDEKKGKKK